MIVYHFHLRYKLSTPHTVRIYGFTLIVNPTVFHPKYYFSSKFFADYLYSIDIKRKKVLDMGCGSGIISIVTASRGGIVCAIDINSEAVKTTMQNAGENQLNESIATFQGDLFTPLPPEAKFDYILFNPPFYPSEPKSTTEQAWKGGNDYRVITEFIDNSSTYLSNEGKILILLSSDMDIPRILERFVLRKYGTVRVQTKRTLFDTLYIYEATRHS